MGNEQSVTACHLLLVICYLLVLGSRSSTVPSMQSKIQNPKSKIIIVGGGLGGLAAGVRLQAAGHCVQVLEKNERLGGKMNIVQGDGYTFDTGPSLLTMPWVIQQLW